MQAHHIFLIGVGIALYVYIRGAYRDQEAAKHYRSTGHLPAGYDDARTTDVRGNPTDISSWQSTDDPRNFVYVDRDPWCVQYHRPDCRCGPDHDDEPPFDRIEDR